MHADVTAVPRAVVSVTAVLAVAVGLGACGADHASGSGGHASGSGGHASGSGGHTSGTAGHKPPSLLAPEGRLSRRPPASLLRGALPPVGATQYVDAGGARLGVTLRRVIDPLRGSGAQLPGRSRAVAVIMQIRSAGPKLYDSSATGDIKLIASSGPATPVLATRGICRTPVNDFD